MPTRWKMPTTRFVMLTCRLMLTKRVTPVRYVMSTRCYVNMVDEGKIISDMNKIGNVNREGKANIMRLVDKVSGVNKGGFKTVN